MDHIFIRWLVLTAAIMLTSYLLEGIHVSGVFSAFFAAAMLSILNAFLRPVLIIMTLPINILSMGLFTFVINGILLAIASVLIPGFYVSGFWSAVFGSIFISIASYILNSLIWGQQTTVIHKRESKKPDFIDLKHKGGDKWE